MVPDKISKLLICIVVITFLSISLTYVLGAQMKRLIETVLLSTHNIYFGLEIKFLFLITH